MIQKIKAWLRSFKPFTAEERLALKTGDAMMRWQVEPLDSDEFNEAWIKKNLEALIEPMPASEACLSENAILAAEKAFYDAWDKKNQAILDALEDATYCPDALTSKNDPGVSYARGKKLIGFSIGENNG